MANPTVTWTTNSGTYEYSVHDIGTSFKNVGGNYVFARKNADGRYSAIYVGQTNDLGVRLADHEKQPCSVKNGATHILAHVNTSKAAREAEEADLIAWCQPTCNEMLK